MKGKKKHFDPYVSPSNAEMVTASGPKHRPWQPPDEFEKGRVIWR